MLNNYTRFNFFFIFKFSFGGKKDVVCNIKRKSVNTFKYSHGYSLISFSSYSEKTRSLNIIEVSNWIFRDWILYKETILTLWGHVLWRDVFKKEFPEYRLERKCCVTITRREEGFETFRPAVLKREVWRVSNCIMDGRNISLWESRVITRFIYKKN